jgi:uncharacterized membrane protein YkoI
MRSLEIFARLSRRSLLTLVAMLTPDVGAALESVGYDHVTAREAVRRGEILPLSRILAIAQVAVPGDVLKIRLVRHAEYGWRYRVRVLAASGQLRMVRMDARTGRITDVTDE